MNKKKAKFSERPQLSNLYCRQQRPVQTRSQNLSNSDKSYTAGLREITKLFVFE